MSVMESLKIKADSVLGSASGLRKVGVDVVEKTTRGALDSCGFYNGLGIRQLRSFAAISDLNSARAFVADSVSLSGDVFKRVIDDLQKTIAIGSEVRSSLGDTLNGAAKAEEAPARKTAKSSAA